MMIDEAKTYNFVREASMAQMTWSVRTKFSKIFFAKTNNFPV